MAGGCASGFLSICDVSSLPSTPVGKCSSWPDMPPCTSPGGHQPGLPTSCPQSRGTHSNVPMTSSTAHAQGGPLWIHRGAWNWDMTEWEEWEEPWIGWEDLQPRESLPVWHCPPTPRQLQPREPTDALERIRNVRGRVSSIGISSHRAPMTNCFLAGGGVEGLGGSAPALDLFFLGKQTPHTWSCASIIRVNSFKFSAVSKCPLLATGNIFSHDFKITTLPAYTHTTSIQSLIKALQSVQIIQTDFSSPPTFPRVVSYLGGGTC